ncbi:MAG: diacylglycerol kinase family protein [Pseudomonadota bacterium]
MPGIGIIVNPHSRGHRKDPTKAERLGFIVGEKGSCHTTKDLNQVEQLARQFKQHKIEILGISGGDGTNHKTLTTFLNVYGDQKLPKIAFLRGGTMNNLANCLNIKGTSEKILSNLILKYHEEIPFEETEIDLLKINDSYGFIFGMGVVSRFIDVYDQHKNGDPTPWRAIRLLGQAVGSCLLNTGFSIKLCERFDAQITVDGKTGPFKNYNMIMAGTIEELGFKFRPICHARKNPGQFHLVALSATPLQLLYTLPPAFLARELRPENSFDIIGKKATIELDIPHRYTVDGDTPEESSKINIEVGQRLKVIVS